MQCPKCTGFLKKRAGVYGKFLGCSAYPKCQYTFSIQSFADDHSPWISASAVGAAKFCPHTVYLKKHVLHKKHKAYRYMQKGLKAHAYISKDRRCYIATYAFHENHYIVKALRDWRDYHLLTSKFGRVLVSFYYRISPIIIVYLGNSVLFKKIARYCIKYLYKNICKSQLCC